MSDRIIEMLRHHAAHAHSSAIRAHCAEMLIEIQPDATPEHDGGDVARCSFGEAIPVYEPASDARPIFPAIVIVLGCAVLGLSLIGIVAFIAAVF